MSMIVKGSRRIHYDLLGAGQGDCVCLLHAICVDTGMWANQVPALLDAGYRVLRIDLAGHGGTEPLDGAVDLDAMGNDVITVLDALGIERTHLVGLSLGGLVAATIAPDLGERVITLIISSAGPGSPPDAAEQWTPRLEAARRAGSPAPLAEPMTSRWVSDAYQGAAPEVMAQLRDAVAATTLAGFEQGATILTDFRLNRLAEIARPTLVIWGEDDGICPPIATRKLAEGIPRTEITALPGARHFPNIDAAEAFTARLTDFLTTRTSR